MDKRSSPLTLAAFIRGLARILVEKPPVPPSLAGHALLTVILGRRSVRQFKEDPIPEDVLTAILEAGRMAPSTVNLQSWSFFVFDRSSWQDKFGRKIPFKSQQAVIVCADMHRNREVFEGFPHSLLVEYTTAVINASLAAMNMTLAAEALGVSSVMLSETGKSGFLDAGYLREKLGLPTGVFPLTTIVLGYARNGLRPIPPKLPLAQVCFRDGLYHEPDPRVMQEWLEKMRAGYKAMAPASSLEAQLKVYESKIHQAEEDLQKLIFGS